MTELNDPRTLDNATIAIVTALTASPLIETVEQVTKSRGNNSDSDGLVVVGHLVGLPGFKFNVELVVS